MAEIDAISHEINEVVECDVDDLVENVRVANTLLALHRADRTEAAKVSLLEVVSSRRESFDMVAEDIDVSTQRVPTPLVEPELIATLSTWHEETGEMIGYYDEDAIEEFEAIRAEQFEEEHGASYAEVQMLRDQFMLQFGSQYTPIRTPDGSIGFTFQEHAIVVPVLGRHGANSVSLEWTQVQHEERFSAKLRRIRRVVLPELVASIVLDARSRWGLLPDTPANRLMVGHHMRKQLRNHGLRVAAVDAHIALALNRMFVPISSDVVANGQMHHHSVGYAWRAYDEVAMTWWQRLTGNGHASHQLA